MNDRRHYANRVLPNERKPIAFHHLCAIARLVITAAPAIDDFEWRERIKCELVRQGFQYPTRPEMLGEAQDAVTRALEREGIRRHAPAVVAVTPRAEDAPIGRAEAAALVAQLQAGDAIKRMPAARLLTVHEVAKRKALRMVAAEIAASIARCEELERVVAEEPELVT